MAIKNITLHTSLTTNLQKELEGHESIPKRISDACTYLSSLLKVAYGSNGRAVMVQKQNGQMMITRSGSQILDHMIPEYKLCDPIFKILINCARNVEMELGDGVKRFIFYTSTIFKVLTSDLNCNLFREKLNQLVCIQNAMKLVELDYTGRTDVLDLNLLKSIFNSFFSTRFSAPVCNMFINAAHKWISCFNASNEIDGSTLIFIHKNFNVFCKRDKNHSSISESIVSEGILLKGEMIKPSPIQTEEFKSFLIVYHLEIEKRTRKNTEHDLMNILDEELSKPRTIPLLLVTNMMLSDTLKCFVRMKNILSLQGVLEEEVLFLHNYLLSYFKSVDCIINCSFQCINTLKLSLSNVSQLVISSPTTDIGLQLHSALFNLITSLKYLVCNNLMVFGSNSIFLDGLYRSLTSKAVRSNLPPILNRKSILTDWHDSESSSVSKRNLGEKSSPHQFVLYTIGTILDCKYMNNESLILLGNIIFPLINSQAPVDVSESFSDFISLEMAVLCRSLSAAIKLLSIDRVLDAKRLSCE